MGSSAYVHLFAAKLRHHIEFLPREYRYWNICGRTFITEIWQMHSWVFILILISYFENLVHIMYSKIDHYISYTLVWFWLKYCRHLKDARAVPICILLKYILINTYIYIYLYRFVVWCILFRFQWINFYSSAQLFQSAFSGTLEVSV